VSLFNASRVPIPNPITLVSLSVKVKGGDHHDVYLVQQKK